MRKQNTSIEQEARGRQTALLPVEQAGSSEIEPSLWGGNWAMRFAANFTRPPEPPNDPAAAELAGLVNRAITNLPLIERRIIIDYHILCLPRQAIARRCGIERTQVHDVRLRAERRLRGVLAGFVQRRYGIPRAYADDCPLCKSTERRAIDRLLIGRRPQESWAALRRLINQQFTLNVKRVQVLITHCRDHLAHPDDGE